jgi:predicted aspartyl protease
MIVGRVNDALEPILEVGLKRGETVTAISATIDTGFSGMLCLAERHRALLDLEFGFIERYELANGEVITKDVFRELTVIDGREQGVEIILRTECMISALQNITDSAGPFSVLNIWPQRHHSFLRHVNRTA